MKWRMQNNLRLIQSNPGDIAGALFNWQDRMDHSNTSGGCCSQIGIKKHSCLSGSRPENREIFPYSSAKPEIFIGDK